MTSSRSVAASEQPDLARFSRFCERFLSLEDGRPLKLERFQRDLLTDYFEGATETLVLIPKKNGKSTLLAALALYHLMTTPDAECVIAAASRDQAAVLFGQAAGFVRRSPALQERVDPKQRELRSMRDSGRIRIMASDVDTADGVIPTLAFVDELHRHKSNELYGVFMDGLGPRNGQMITISTAGDDEGSPLGGMRATAYAYPGLTRRDEDAYTYAKSPNGDFVMHEWALLPTDDREDMTVVKRANPASWHTLPALARRHDSPSMTPWRWARFACGVWVRGDDAAISPLDWAKCARPRLQIPHGADVWVGMDLGWKWDTTALVPVHFKDLEDIEVGVPEVIRPPRDGTSLPEEEILDAIERIRDEFDIRGLVFDRSAGGEQLAQRLERDFGLEVIPHSQQAAPMSLAAERLSACIRTGALKHPDDPELTAHVLAASARTTSGEAWRLEKARKSPKPIDAVIALAMAVSVAIGEALEPRRRRSGKAMFI